MEGALKKKTKNLSTKKVQYQQELRRYLKARKEKMNKPIKVSIVSKKNKPNVRLNTTGAEPNVVVSTPSTMQNSTASLVNSDGEVEEQFEIDQASESGSFKSPESPAVKFYRYVMKNPRNFGLSVDGKVIRGQKEVASSHLPDIIEHIFNGGGPGTSTPPGFKTFYNKVVHDKFLKELKGAHNITVTPKRGQFNPERWR